MVFEPARISGQVPVSQRHGGRRVVALSLNLAKDQWTDDAKNLGVDMRNSVGAGTAGADTPINAVRYAELFRGLLRVQGVQASELAGLDETVAILQREPKEQLAPSTIREILSSPAPLRFSGRSAVELLTPVPRFASDRGLLAGSPMRSDVGITPAAEGLARSPVDLPRMTLAPGGGTVDPVDAPPLSLPAIPELSDAFAALAQGSYVLPFKTWSGRIELRPYEPPVETNPTFFLIEEYAITSKLGDFGLGTTSGLYSLFPGEATEISMKTWLTTTESFTQGSSIVDSFNSTSADKFNSTLEQKAGQSASIDAGTSYSNEWHAGGGFSFIVSVEGGGGETRSEQLHVGRESFAGQTSAAVEEHAASANANRQTNISSSTDRTSVGGTEQATIRTIRNVNMRHCLNVAFRELNQEYITRVHVVDLRIGFQNGQIGSWREAPLSQLRSFVTQFVTAGHVDEVCSKLVKFAAVVFDNTDTPVPVLQQLTWENGGLNMKVGDAEPDALGRFDPPSDTTGYRFRLGPLGQDEVDGVVLSETKVIMQTGTLVADALLSPGEALDEYAMERQKADTEAAVLANDRANGAIAAEKIASARAEAVVDALTGIADPEKRMAAYADAFRPIVAEGDAVPLDG
jgi:hypothetical protein